jgi:DNA-binding CsgD family transcriptional regulator
MYIPTLVVVTFEVFLSLFVYLYNMVNFLIYILFLLTVAFASAGIILSSRLRSRSGTGFLSSLMYFQVFIYTFGFYGIWGQVVIKAFLTNYVSPEAINRFTDISLLLGLPFLVFGWLMLIKVSLEVSGKESNNWFVFIFLLINFLIILSVGYLISTKEGIKPLLVLRYYFIILSFLSTILAAIILITPGKSRPVLLRSELRVAAFVIVVLMLLQALFLYFYEGERVIGMVFIFLFFAGNSFLPLFLSYGTDMILGSEEDLTDITFDEFCKKFQISSRESDIIREICNGLSNKEISEKLFISLQTVKDHTHRIYIKTNVRSRAQLANMVKEVREIKS